MDDPYPTYFVTYHVQQDRRITLGTAMHRNPNCTSLRGRSIASITGTIVSKLAVCKKCRLGDT